MLPSVVEGDMATRRSGSAAAAGRRPAGEARNAASRRQASEHSRHWDMACRQRGRAWRRSGMVGACSSEHHRREPCSWRWHTAAGPHAADGGDCRRRGRARSAAAGHRVEAEDRQRRARNPCYRQHRRPLAPTAQPADARGCSSCRLGVVLWLLR